MVAWTEGGRGRSRHEERLCGRRAPPSTHGRRLRLVGLIERAPGGSAVSAVAAAHSAVASCSRWRFRESGRAINDRCLSARKRSEQGEVRIARRLSCERSRRNLRSPAELLHRRLHLFRATPRRRRRRARPTASEQQPIGAGLTMAENHKIENSMKQEQIVQLQKSPPKENQLSPQKQKALLQQKQQQPVPKALEKEKEEEEEERETPIELQPPPPPRNKAQPLRVPEGQAPHYRLQRRASDVIDSGGSSPMGSPGSGLLLGSLPREYTFGRSPLPSPLSPRSPASDRGYGGSTFNSPVTPLRDTTDAAPIIPVADDEPQTGYNEVPVADMAVEKDAEEYNMRHRRRGRAIIFNNDEFQMVDASSRAGSSVDVKSLSLSFSALQFEVQVHTNKQYGEIREILSQLAAEDHSDADCLAIAVLTHGLPNGFLLAQDVPYPVHMLWQPFTANNCLTLAGKPKLFFIQACRGEGLDSGVTLRHRSRTETDSGRNAYKIPTHSDFLLAYSAPEGFYSWRNPELGTWFIQCLCEELNANAQRMDMLRILTRVSRRVALDYESFNDLIPWQNQCKQVPSFTSMLIRDLIFHPKV